MTKNFMDPITCRHPLLIIQVKVPAMHKPPGGLLPSHSREMQLVSTEFLSTDPELQYKITFPSFLFYLLICCLR